MPQLVLYSDGIVPENGPIHERMLRLIGKPKPDIGYIPSAGDPEGVWFAQNAARYEGLGASMTVSFSVDEEYDASILPRLLACDAIHLSGGNTFGFLLRLQRHRMLSVLKDYVARGGVLIGTSAGAILMTPEISSATLCGDEDDEGLVDRKGLGLVDFGFFPHYRPLRSRAARAHQSQATFPLYACPDGAGIVVDGQEIEFFGKAERFEARRK